MDEVEARRLVSARLDALRAVGYRVLVDRLAGCRGGRGRRAVCARYQLEAQGVWDAAEGADLRVIVSVDDGGLRAFAPVSDDFIVASDGSFVGE